MRKSYLIGIKLLYLRKKCPKKSFFQIYFDNETLLDITKEIGKWYNVSVIFHSPEKIHTRLFFAAPRTGSINDVVEILNGFNKAKVTLEDGQMVIE